MRRLLARYLRRSQRTPINDYILAATLCLTVCGVVGVIALRPAPAWVATLVLGALNLVLLGCAALAWRASSRRQRR